GPPYNTASSWGTCVTDSISHFSPLNHASTTIYGTGPSGKYGLDVSGGADLFRYYLAGVFSNAIGGVHLPNVFIPEATALGFPASAFKPNAENQRSARSNMTVRLGSTTDIQANLTYTSSYMEAPAVSNLSGPDINGGPNLDDSVYNYG